MYLISHPLMVLPLLRITQGKKGGWGCGGTRAWRQERREGGRTGLKKDRGRGNQELYKVRVNSKKE